MDREPEERAPLLCDEAGSDGGHDRETPTQNTHSLSTVVLYFMAIHFLLAFCEMILVAPLIKLFEESLCLSHYDFPHGGVEESRCKIPEIQRPLATIRGWKAMFDTLPGTAILSKSKEKCSHISSVGCNSNWEAGRPSWTSQNYGVGSVWSCSLPL